MSGVGWVVAQFQLGQHLVGDPARLLPLSLGSFHFLAWQFLWTCGLALGETMLRQPVIRPERRQGVMIAAGAVVAMGLFCRHGLDNEGAFAQMLYRWVDKWTRGPLRMQNFGAWVALLLAWNPRLPRLSLAPMALLGRNSLAIFAFHLPLVIIATTLIESFPFSTSAQLFIGSIVIVQMFAWASWLESWQREPKPVKAQVREAPTPELVPA